MYLRRCLWFWLTSATRRMRVSRSALVTVTPVCFGQGLASELTSSRNAEEHVFIIGEELRFDTGAGGTDDAVPAQHEPLLFRGRVSMAFPAPTMSIRFRRPRGLYAHSQKDQDRKQSAAARPLRGWEVASWEVASYCQQTGVPASALRHLSIGCSTSVSVQLSVPDADEFHCRSRGRWGPHSNVDEQLSLSASCRCARMAPGGSHSGHFVNEIDFVDSECLEGMEADHIKPLFWLQAYKNEVYLLPRDR